MAITDAGITALGPTIAVQQSTSVHIEVFTNAGVPNQSKPKGSLCIDTTNAKLYITTDAVGTWVVVGTQT